MNTAVSRSNLSIFVKLSVQNLKRHLVLRYFNATKNYDNYLIIMIIIIFFLQFYNYNPIVLGAEVDGSGGIRPLG